MTDKEREILSQRIDDLQAANELTVENLKELARDFFRQRIITARRKHHVHQFYDRMMEDQMNRWRNVHPIKWFQRLYTRFCKAVK